jgi:Cu+-exporting ATPase
VPHDKLTVSNFSEATGKGIQAEIDGQMIKIGSAHFMNNNSIANQNDSSKTFVSINDEVKGAFVFKPKYRENLETVISKLKAEYQLSLISGDKDTDRKTLEEKFSAATPLHFNQSPHDKLQYIYQLQNNHQKVMMIGDGLNDAGALKQSHVGVAISDNINNFSPACDAILDGSQFQQLAQILNYCKTAVRLVKISFLISLLYNVVGVTIAVQGLLSPLFAAIVMPLSSISVVVFGTVATRWAARKQLFDND